MDRFIVPLPSQLEQHKRSSLKPVPPPVDILPPWTPIIIFPLISIYLALPRSALRDWTGCSIPVAWLAFLYAVLPRQEVRPGFSEAYAILNVATSLPLAAVLLLFLENMNGPLKRNEDKLAIENWPDATWLDRLKVSASVSFSARGIGTNKQAKNVPPAAPPGYSRWKFVGDQILRLIPCILTEQIIIAYGRSTVQAAWPKPVSLYSMSSQEQVIMGWMQAVRLGVNIAKFYSAGAAISVALGIYAPEQWPPIFGKWSETYTLRHFWGHTWHQNLRRIFDAWCDFIVRDTLGVTPGTFASRYLRLFLSFALSGYIHAGASLLCTKDDSNAMRFFLVQAAAIFVEDHVVKAGKAVGIKENLITRNLGRLWLIVFFSYSLIGYAAGLIKHGALLNKLLVE